MHTAAAFFAVSVVGSALALSVWDLGAWRALGGVAIGLASVIGPTYIAEIAPAAYRGRLASFQQNAIVLGITASQLVSWVIAKGAGGRSESPLGPLDARQCMLAAALVPALLYLVLTARIPESPHYRPGWPQAAWPWSARSAWPCPWRWPRGPSPSRGGTGDDISIPDTQGAVALVAVHTFVFFFAVSWGVILWGMVGEMFPFRIRAAAMSVATASNWIADWNLSATYTLYAGFALLSALFVARVVDETRGRRLEEAP